MKAHPPTVLFAAGGTGGHIYPAIAVADAMRELEPEVRVVFVGTAYGLETTIVPQHGYPLELIDVRFLKGTSLLKKIKHTALLPRSAWQSWRLLRRLQPGLVVGAGGYASGPVVGIAAATRRPTAILEQNAIPGLTNRILGRFVRQVFVSFEAERYPFAASKVHALGNPVRSMSVDEPDVAREDGRVHVLVFGGSQGAKSLNEEMPRILSELGADASRIYVRHQSGRERDQPVRDAYDSFAGRAEVTEFIQNMPAAYQWADVIVCRAGATTVAELKAAGKAAILVPFPYAAHNHQEKNAQAMVDAGAALMVRDRDMPGDAMVKTISRCLEQPDTIAAMSARALEIAQPRAAHDVAQACLDMMQLKSTSRAGTIGAAASACTTGIA